MAYVLAYALGAIRVVPDREGRFLQADAAAPTPEEFMDAMDAIDDDDFLGMKWHVVFKGKRPGVYPSW